MNKNKYIIQLETNLEDYSPSIPIVLFKRDIWSSIESYADEIIAIHEFQKFVLGSWFKNWLTRKKDYPKISSLGSYNQQSIKEQERISILTEEGNIDFLYEVKKNGLITKLIQMYKGQYTLESDISEFLKEDFNSVLEEFFERSDPDSKFIFFGHDGEPVFIFFFSEELLNQII